MDYSIHSSRQKSGLETIVGVSAGILLASSFSSCKNFEAEQSIAPPQEVAQQSQLAEPTPTTEKIPFYAKIPDEPLIGVERGTGERGTGKLFCDSEEQSEGKPFLTTKSLTLNDEAYGVNIDLVTDETFREVGVKYTVTFFKRPSTPKEVPTTMLLYMTDCEGKPLRLNYRQCSVGEAVNSINVFLGGAVEKTSEGEPSFLVMSSQFRINTIIVQQNPFSSLYGCNPEDKIAKLSYDGSGNLQQGDAVLGIGKDTYSPESPEAPIPLAKARALILEEQEKLHVRPYSCKQALETAQQLLGNETTLDDYLNRK